MIEVRKPVPIADLIGRRFASIIGLKKDSEEVTFIMSDGNVYRMYHEKDCCENVSIVDAPDAYDIAQCLGEIVVGATEESREATIEDAVDDDSGTWTFYGIQTAKGKLAIRWLGTSNGYYSESVDFQLLFTGEAVAPAVVRCDPTVQPLPEVAGVRRIDLD